MELIAKGRYNEVFKDGKNVVKVFNEGYSKADVLTEALIVAKVEDLELNTPKIDGVTKIDGKWAITMECVEGKTLSQLMEENPDDTDKYVEMMVDIQMNMFSKKCPSLQKLKEKMTDRINKSGVDDAKKYELLARLESTPKHEKLCHGDFTPQNIIIDKKGVAHIIDWNHATIGNASADVARSYLWLSLYNEAVADKYLAKFCEKSKTDKTYVQKWLPIVAAARLTKKVEEEKELLDKWIDVVEYQ